MARRAELVDSRAAMSPRGLEIVDGSTLLGASWLDGDGLGGIDRDTAVSALCDGAGLTVAECNALKEGDVRAIVTLLAAAAAVAGCIDAGVPKKYAVFCGQVGAWFARNVIDALSLGGPTWFAPCAGPALDADPRGEGKYWLKSSFSTAQADINRGFALWPTATAMIWARGGGCNSTQVFPNRTWYWGGSDSSGPHGFIDWPFAGKRTEAWVEVCRPGAQCITRTPRPEASMPGHRITSTPVPDIVNGMKPLLRADARPVGTGVSSGATSTTAGYRCAGTTPTCVVVSAKGTNAAALMGKALDAARCAHLAPPTCGAAPKKTSTGVKVAIGVGAGVALLAVLARTVGR
jgi:hypothetical protein